MVLGVNKMTDFRLNIPLSLEDVKKLKLGDYVSFDGLIYTCRGLFHKRVIEDNIDPPFDLEEMNVMVHMGPVVTKKPNGYDISGMQPTTSNRYEKWAADIIRRLSIRAIVGKGTMGENTARFMREFGCVHLTAVGVAAALLPLKAEVKTVHWLDLGSIEATWIFEVKDFGPFMVDIDTRGNQYFGKMESHIEKNRQQIYVKMGIPKDFRYSVM
jgi:tartrate/fumarate subfamily iron-sulfur-dependent hydro-lyase beta chain